MKGNIASLRPTIELAATRPHGDRLRYLGGCRCDACRRANTEYEKQRAAARKAGDWNGLVRAERARAHIEALAAAGVGRRQVADAAKISVTVIVKIKSGEKETIRARTEKAILAVTAAAMADHALIDAGPTWKLLEELLATGYTKARLAHELGYERGALQIRRTQCTLRNAYDVQRLHERLRRVPAKAALQAIAGLQEEGYRRDRVLAMARDLATRSGSAGVDLDVHQGQWIAAAAAEIFAQLHHELTAEPVEA